MPHHLFCASSVAVVFTLPFLHSVLAHGGHDHPRSQAPLVAADADWATLHMASEHHISSFDAASFFQIHNYGGSGAWDVGEILRTYGVSPKSPAEAVQGSEDWAVRVVSDERRKELMDGVMTIFDANRDGLISKEEYEEGVRQGKALPDFGFGPGHHGDDEWEYEIHHFEKYHADATTMEELNHPEDYAHFALHDALDDEADRQQEMDQMRIVEANIPAKFRRGLQ